MNDQHRKQLQGLMEDPRWGAVEAFMQDFMIRNFATDSIKRETEFDTMWYAAMSEGGKQFIPKFFKEMEDEARGLDTQ